MLDVLVRHHPLRLTEAQWATLVGMARTGGTWRQYRGALLKAGLVAVAGDVLWSATDAGLAYSGVDPKPMTTDEVLATWRSALRAGARNILDVLIEVHPTDIAADELAARVGMEPSGGTFRQYVGHLVRNGLAERRNGHLRAGQAVMGV